MLGRYFPYIMDGFKDPGGRPEYRPKRSQVIKSKKRRKRRKH